MSPHQEMIYNEHTVLLVIVIAIAILLIVTGITMLVNDRIGNFVARIVTRRRDTKNFKVVERGRRDFG